MGTVPLEVEKLLAAFVLALCDLGTCTASRALIKFCIWPVIFAIIFCFGLRKDLKPIEVNFSLDRYSTSSFQCSFLLITFRLIKPVLNGQLPIVNLTFKSVDDMLQKITVTCYNSIVGTPLAECLRGFIYFFGFYQEKH